MPESFLNIGSIKRELIDKIESDVNPKITNKFLITLSALIGLLLTAGIIKSSYENDKMYSMLTTYEKLENIDNSKLDQQHLIKIIQKLEERIKILESDQSLQNNEEAVTKNIH